MKRPKGRVKTAKPGTGFTRKTTEKIEKESKNS